MTRNDEALVGGFHGKTVPDQRFLRAEGAGFEPAGPEGPTVFKTVPFVRSGTPPGRTSVPRRRGIARQRCCRATSGVGGI